MKRIICIYHSRDLDGWMSAAVIMKLFLGSKIKFQDILKDKIKSEDTIVSFLAWDYGDKIPDLKSYNQVIMCDISFPKDIMLQLRLKLGLDFIWIDHHASAIEENKNHNFEGLQDPNFAACELAWMWYFPMEKIPEIIKLLGSYDCMRDGSQEVLEFQYGARQAIGNYIQAYSHLEHNLNNDGLDIVDVESGSSILTNGKAIYKYLCTEAKQIYSKATEIHMGKSPTKLIDVTYLKDLEPITLREAKGIFLPYKFLCVNRERFNPINFGIDYHAGGYDGFACYWRNNGRWAYSIYNDNKKVDCAKIAKQYGGGGHRGAAGFIVDKLI